MRETVLLKSWPAILVVLLAIASLAIFACSEDSGSSDDGEETFEIGSEGGTRHCHVKSDRLDFVAKA